MMRAALYHTAGAVACLILWTAAILRCIGQAITAVRSAPTKARIWYYTSALRQMGLQHPDAGHVLLHISSLRDRLSEMVR